MKTNLTKFQEVSDNLIGGAKSREDFNNRMIGAMSFYMDPVEMEMCLRAVAAGFGVDAMAVIYKPDDTPKCDHQPLPSCSQHAAGVTCHWCR